ncbi:SPOR domain-containing protein [Vibrio stylophorae]|nr:SPOR domain-containing protein [Vibrio stylophorae]
MMKKIIPATVLLAFLSGCSTSNPQISTSSTVVEEIKTAPATTQPALTENSNDMMGTEEVSPDLAVSGDLPPAQPMPETVPIVQPEQKPVPEVKPAPKPEPKPIPAVAHKPQANYTLQVMAVSHKKNYQSFVQSLPKHEAIWINEKSVDGIPWYAILYGEFATRDEAKAALNALPASVRKLGPFIRSFESIEKSAYPKLERLN